MKSYNIDIKSFEDNSSNAGSKAHADVNTTLEKSGYRTLFVYLHKNKIAKLFFNMVAMIRYFFIIQAHSRVIIQYPSSKYILLLVKCLRVKKCHLTALIHDLDSCRYDPGMKSYEHRLFNLMDRVIVHTPTMRSILINDGVTSDVRCLGLFDYLLERPYVGKRVNSGDVVFAGNLSKSGFLRQLPTLPLSYVTLHLFGLPKYDATNAKIKYDGVFKPDDLSGIDGSWGLVWDGDSLDDLTGITGNYQTINSPHKASLYIAAGLPLIVSRRSALADYVVAHNLGITINSLQELDDQLKNFTDEKYNELLRAVEMQRMELLTGRHLRDNIEI